MSTCAPDRENRDWTCFTLEELRYMTKAWNATRNGRIHKINLVSSNNEKEYLWTALRDRFKPYCGDNESCWLDSIDLNKSLKNMSPEVYRMINHFTLKPKGTKGSQDWLSTREIDYVMQQYEKAYPKLFKYIGCYPSNFYILEPEKFPLEEIANSRFSGLIFNVDEAHQSGSHWVAVFFDNDPEDGLQIEYFDPTGDKPNKNIQEFLYNEEFEDSPVVINKKEHQKGNNECGVYSLYYILTRLHGKSFDEISKRRIPDKAMNDFRKVLFRPYSEAF